MLDPITTVTLAKVAMDVLKIWIPVATVLFGVFKVITWIKNKFISIDSNVVKLTEEMDGHISGLREEIKLQTSTLASALSEQRQDFRTFFTPTLMMLQNQNSLQSAPARAKKAPRKRATKAVKRIL